MPRRHSTRPTVCAACRYTSRVPELDPQNTQTLVSILSFDDKKWSHGSNWILNRIQACSPPAADKFLDVSATRRRGLRTQPGHGKRRRRIGEPDGIENCL